MPEVFPGQTNKFYFNVNTVSFLLALALNIADSIGKLETGNNCSL